VGSKEAVAALMMITATTLATNLMKDVRTILPRAAAAAAAATVATVATVAVALQREKDYAEAKKKKAR
jgi:hypothetical protein